MNNIPQELDWVEKRAACNVGQVFDDVCVGIKKDAEAVNLARQLKEYDQFAVNMLKDGNTIVVGQPSRIPRVVVMVGIVGDQIEVRDPVKGNEWRVRVSLNKEGRCTLIRLEDGTELEQWQFRKKALEGLFFGD